MTTAKNLSFVLALALGAVASGCAADSPDQGGEGGGGGGGGGDGSGTDDAPRAMDASGSYQMVSTFDIATNAPGKVGEVTNTFIAMTDGAADPAEWIIEQIIAKTTNSTLKSALTTAKPFVAGYLNDRLLQIAPDFVDTIIQVGHDFGQMAKNFGLNETLDVTGAGSAYTATVTALGVHFKVDNVESDITFADYSIANVAAQNVALSLDATGKLDIGEHELPLSYGKVLHVGLDAVIIPAVSRRRRTSRPDDGLVSCNSWPGDQRRARLADRLRRRRQHVGDGLHRGPRVRRADGLLEDRFDRLVGARVRPRRHGEGSRREQGQQGRHAADRQVERHADLRQLAFIGSACNSILVRPGHGYCARAVRMAGRRRAVSGQFSTNAQLL